MSAPANSSLTRTLASILADPTQASTKRLAWAYGYARKGSPEEAQLATILRDRILDESPPRATLVPKILEMLVTADLNDYASGFNHGLREACHVVDPDAPTPPILAEAWAAWPIAPTQRDE